jgi:hypothetical protein
MKIQNPLQDVFQDKIENVKQQKIEHQKVFDSRILPHENHTLYEVNLKEKTIEKVIFEKKPIIKWEDAVKGQISISKEVIKKPDCIYISALNIKNVRKILFRDFGYDFA